MLSSCGLRHPLNRWRDRLYASHFALPWIPEEFIRFRRCVYERRFPVYSQIAMREIDPAGR